MTLEDGPLVESAGHAQAAVAEFAGHRMTDRVVAARGALAAFEREAGFEGGFEVQVWQLLVAVHDFCTVRGTPPDEALDCRDASAAPRPGNLVGGLRMLCGERGVDFDAILADVRASFPDLDRAAPAAPGPR